MDRMLYVAMTGARQIQVAQAANANNLANINTNGFKSDFNNFRSMPLFGPGQPTRVYAMDEKPGVDFSAGVLQRTGRDMDFAIEGDGWFSIESADGSEAYSRDGNLHLGPGNRLVTSTGQTVLGNSGPIVVPDFDKLEIGMDGTITVLPKGQDPNALAVVDRIKLVNPPQAELLKGEDGLFRLQNGETAKPDVNVRLVKGALEGSNVSAVEAMVNMLTLQRQFEMQIKMMSSAEQMSEQSAQILRLA